jgi:cytochrome c553
MGSRSGLPLTLALSPQAGRGDRAALAARGRPRRRAAFALAVLLAASPQAASAQSLEERIAQCVACHGAEGQSKDPKIPHIGGQPKLFAMYQLFFYREGRRKSEEMNLVAKGLSDRDLEAVSDWVSKLPPTPPAPGAIDEARFKRGAALAARRQCASCHNPDYSGRLQMARLAGQHEAYTVKALQDYRAGSRVGTQAAMAESVRGLSDADFSDLAYFLAHVRP